MDAPIADAALLAAHLAGDPGAFGVLVDRYGPAVSRLMHRAVRRPQDADELVQETFLHLHRAAADVDRERPLRPYVMTIALNLRREYFRRRGRRPEEPLELDGRHDPHVDADDGIERRDAARRVALALDALPVAQREVIELHWLGGLSMAEVAEAVGASVSAVKVRACRGYERMRDVLRAGR